MKLITVPEFCALLQIDASTECRWRKSGMIPANLYFARQFKRKAFIRYIEERVEEWLTADSPISNRSRRRIPRGNDVATQADTVVQGVESAKEKLNGRMIDSQASAP